MSLTNSTKILKDLPPLFIETRNRYRQASHYLIFNCIYGIYSFLFNYS